MPPARMTPLADLHLIWLATPETTSTNGRGRCRLEKAQAMVQSLACAVTANVGDHAATQLANSANAAEDCFDLHTAA